MSRTRLMAKYALTGVTSAELNLLDDFSGTIASSLPKATTSELGFIKTGGSNLSIGSETVTYTVTIVNVSGSNVFALDGVNNPRLTMVEGSTYNFSNPSYSSHPISFVNASTGASYTDGVTDNQSSTGVITIVVPSGAPQLRYRCTTHGNGMGNLIDITDINPLNKTDTIYTDATASASGLISTSDKLKLDGIADNANNYVLPAATSSTLGGAKIGSGVQESNGILSYEGDILATYSDDVEISQYTSLGSLLFDHKSAGISMFQYGGGSTNLQSSTVNSAYIRRFESGSWASSWSIPSLTPDTDGTVGNSNWNGGWGIASWCSLGTSNYYNQQVYYDDTANNNKGGGPELTIPSGFSTSNKIIVTFFAPHATLSSYHKISDYYASFRYQVGTDRFYEPYHSWGQTGDWDDWDSGQTYTVGTIGSEQILLKNPSTSTTNTESTAFTNMDFGTGAYPNMSFTSIANIPTTSSFKIRPWFRTILPFNTSASSGQDALQSYRGAPYLRGSTAHMRLTAIIIK